MNKQEYVVIVNWTLERRKKFGRKQKQININLFFCQNIDFVSVSRNAKILKNIFVVQINLVQLFMNFLPT